MEERTVFVARHGSREDSGDPGWIGRAKNPYDPGLSLLGINEARRLGERVAGERISYIYSSPYLRAVQTTQFCARTLGRSIRIEAGFGEWLNGDWFQRRPRTASLQRLKRQFPSVDEEYRGLVEPVFPESKEDSIRRFGRTIELVLEQTDDGILIVGHGATFEGVTATLLRGQSFDPGADPASLSRIDYREGSWRLVFRNETSFISRDFVHPGQHL
jgi:broad specificity phosphatase PhoE